MEYKKISDLSFFTEEQKGWFKNYVISSDGQKIENEKTGKEVSRTLHGTRGYVVNLSIYIDGERKQRQIIVHRTVAELFIRPMGDGEKLSFKDGNKLNTDVSNLFYEKTEKSKKVDKSLEIIKKKGITEEGRLCTSCGEFREWKDMAGKKSSICKKCASKRSFEYQKAVKYSERSVSYDTYADRFVSDNPINLDGYLGLKCVKCGETFLITRSRVLNRIKAVKIGHNPKPLVCPNCGTKGGSNE